LLRGTLGAQHDQTLLRALAKAPSDRFGSAAEMADAVAAWPVEGRPAVPEAVRASGDNSDRLMERGAARPAERRDHELWRTPEARLAVRRDPRTARNVLIEERAQPLRTPAVDRLRTIAAAGGPLVQRRAAACRTIGARSGTRRSR
jgi:hypothetical protein